MRSPLRNMCGQSRNKRPYCAVFLTILLGQKVPKTIRSNSGFLKNQHFNQIRRTIHMQNHRAENRFGAVVLSFGCECRLSSQLRTHFGVSGICELGMNTSANWENYICLIRFVSDCLTTTLTAGRRYIWN